MTESDAKRKHNTKFYKDTFEKTSEDRRQKVLDVAISEFAAKGYNATNINDITRKAGISTGAMYSYFASKEDLFLTIVDYGYSILESVLQRITQDSSDLYDCIARMLAASREYAIQYPEINQIYLDLTTQALSSMSARLSNKIEAITGQIYSRFFQKARVQGKLGPDVDDGVAAYCVDNLLVMYQFSFASDYYKERMKIFVGQDKLDDIQDVEARIMGFIRSALR